LQHTFNVSNTNLCITYIRISQTFQCDYNNTSSMACSGVALALLGILACAAVASAANAKVSKSNSPLIALQQPQQLHACFKAVRQTSTLLQRRSWNVYSNTEHLHTVLTNRLFLILAVLWCNRHAGARLC
jgi:hypothetical protein